MATLLPGALAAVSCRCNEPMLVPDAAVVPAPPPPPPPVVRDAGPDVPDASEAGAGPPHHAKRLLPAAPSGGGFKVEGSLPRADAERVLRAGQANMRACFDKAHAENAALEGRVDFRLTVDDRGRVTLGEVVASTLGGDDAEMCMIRATRDFKFPAASGPSFISFAMNFGR
jgi:hypothetical protein